MELLIERKPLRFHELWARCKDRLSKPSLVRALRDLQERKQVIRHARGRKYVEFELNPDNPDIQKLLLWAEKVEITKEKAFEAHAYFVERSREWLSLSLRENKQRKKVVRPLIFAHAALIASALTRLTFRTIEHELDFGKDPLIENLIVEVARRLHLIHKDAVTEIYKTSERAAREAFNDWLRELMGTANEFITEVENSTEANYHNAVTSESSFKN